MAVLVELTDQQQREWQQWLSERPPAIRAVAERLPPMKLYRIKPNGHRVVILSYNETISGDVNLVVDVSGEYNRVLFSRQVFGIKPDDLEECDLPGPEEDVGDTSEEAGYTDDDVKNILIPNIREHLRIKRKEATNEKDLS